MIATKREFKGLKVGVIFRNKEWEMNGRTGWTTECGTVDTVEAIKKRHFQTDEDKPLNNKPNAASTPVTLGDLTDGRRTILYRFNRINAPCWHRKHA